MKPIIVIVSIFFVLKCAFGAKILGVFPMEWGSHYILGTKLMKGLAEAGHDITFISPHQYKNPPKNGSWTDVVLEGFPEEYKALLKNINLFDEGNMSFYEKYQLYANMLFFMSNKTLRHPNVQKLINSNTTFDVVILEQLMNDCHHALSYHYKCPLILLSSIGPNPWINPKVGNPSPVSTIPDPLLNVDHSHEMTFLERLKNFALIIFGQLFMEFYVLSEQNRILHQVFPEAPDIHDLYYNASLVLLNSHTSLTNAVPLVPNMVEIGGYHIDAPQRLPEDLQEFLDDAKDGAIYFSMGSSLKSKNMPEDKKKVLLDVFGKLKQKVLWKFEEDLLSKPKNLLIKKWMPQQDILAHPNIKLFITLGGILSTTETIYHGIPVLVIPVFGDQEMNARKAVQSGIGLKISFNDVKFNEITLNNLIQELLINPKYRKNAQFRSKIFHDRPMTPMQNAVYWVEYVIRNNGAPHLRVAGIGMAWYKYFMVDVMVALLLALSLIGFIIKYIIKKLLCYFRHKRNSIESVKLQIKKNK